MSTPAPEYDAAPFGRIIHTYTRVQALDDGVQVRVSNTAAEAGILFPVFLTSTVYDTYVAVPPGVTGQDEAGRLWDILWMLRFAIRRAPAGAERIPSPSMCAMTTERLASSSSSPSAARSSSTTRSPQLRSCCRTRIDRTHCAGPGVLLGPALPAGSPLLFSLE